MLNAECKKKVGKLLPLLASDKPGEIVGTAAALVRVLNSHGSDLHELVTTINTPSKVVRETSPAKSIYLDQIVLLKYQVGKLTEYNEKIKNERDKLKTDLEAAASVGAKLIKFIFFLFVVIVIMYLTR
jgi:hypothetical protein